MKRGWNLYVKFPSHTFEHERVKIHPINIILNDLELLHLLPYIRLFYGIVNHSLKDIENEVVDDERGKKIVI